MRLFIAVNFDDRTKRNILAVQERLRAMGRGNFSLPENLHLTLAFLGEVRSEWVDAIRQAMEQTTFRPFQLTFHGTGRFSREGGDLWWIGCAENPELIRLQAGLSGKLSAAGFSLERRRFSPHITLARGVRLWKGQVSPAGLLTEPFSTEVSTISLMLSERVGGQLTYTELFSVPAEMQ